MATAAEGAGGGSDALDVRASDDERNAIIEILREQTGAGRLTLAEFEERLDDVMASRTRRELQHALRELPVSPPPAVPGHDAGAITDDELRRRYRARLRGQLSGFVIPNFVCNFIWFMGDHGYWWPGWVLMGTGVGIVGTLIQGFDPEEERRRLLAERRDEAMDEIENRVARRADEA